MDRNPPEARADFFDPCNMDCGLQPEAVQALIHMANCHKMQHLKRKWVDD